MRKGHCLQLNGLHPQYITGPKYFQMFGKVELDWRDLVELSESKSEVRKPEGGNQRDRGSGVWNVRRGTRIRGDLE
jgi:hypothetical protein